MFERKQLIGANFSFQHYPFRWTVERLREFGFREIELWGVAPHLSLFHDSKTQLSEANKVLADNGITVRCFTPEQVLYPVNIASGDKAYREASVESFERAADICAELGGKYLFLTPGRGLESESREIAWEHSVASINRIAAYARACGVSCLLEPLQRVETNVANNADDLHALWRLIDGNDVDVVLDTVAMATAGDSIDLYVSKFGKHIAHVQVVDGTPAGHLVWGDGNLPLDTYLSELASHGYEGTITFEPFGNGSYALDPTTAWRRSLDAIAPHFQTK